MNPIIDQSMVSRLPIFPLSDIVLIPGTLLPLHTFEPRYCAMAEAVLAGNKLMGVARRRGDTETDDADLCATAGLGLVIAGERLKEGRYNLLLRGISRIHIEEELPRVRAYREVRAQLIADSETRRPHAMHRSYEQIVTLCTRLSGSMESASALRRLVRAAESPGACADLIAAALISDLDTRQALLETPDPADRLDVVLHHLGRALVELAPQTGLAN